MIVLVSGFVKKTEKAWTALVSGDAALAAGLQASLNAIPPRKQDA